MASNISVAARRRPHTVIEQLEQIPLGRILGLEVPENPALGLGLERLDLRADVVGRGGLVVLTPRADVVDLRAGPDVA